MSILLGIRPGGRDGFAVAAIFWDGKPPAHLILSKSFSGVQPVLNQVMSVVGEWGELDAAAIDAPLTWSGTPTGLRKADEELRGRVPTWVPASWFRSPNSLTGATAIQGPALAWVMRVETKLGNLPPHEVYETDPRASLARTARDLRQSVLGYRDRRISAANRRAHVKRLVGRFVDSGNLAIESDEPSTAEQLEALVAGLAALGATVPQSGLVTHLIRGGPIRPVGSRDIVVLDALP